jgi:O-antigen ligase
MTFRRARRCTLFFVMSAAALMSLVPAPNDPLTILFILALLSLFIVNLFEFLSCPVLDFRLADAFLVGFLLFCLSSYFTAYSFGTSFADWARAAVPFVFMTFFWLVRIDDKDDVTFTIDIILTSCLIWSTKIVFLSAYAFLDDQSNILSRLTFATLDAALPFGIVGCICSLYLSGGIYVRFRYLLFIYFLIFVIAVGYRAQIFILLCVLAAFLFELKWRNRLIFLSILLASLAVGVVGLRDVPAVALLTERISNIGEDSADSARQLERKFGLDQFYDSPIVGKGLGFQVPAALSFNDDIAALLSTTDRDTVGYLHNILVYLLMDLGLVGLTLYGSYWIAVLFTPRRIAEGRATRGLIAVILGMGVFFMTSASFRSIQTVALMSVCAAALTASKQRIPQALEQSVLV